MSWAVVPSTATYTCQRILCLDITCNRNFWMGLHDNVTILFSYYSATAPTKEIQFFFAVQTVLFFLLTFRFEDRTQCVTIKNKEMLKVNVRSRKIFRSERRHCAHSMNRKRNAENSLEFKELAKPKKKKHRRNCPKRHINLNKFQLTTGCHILVGTVLILSTRTFCKRQKMN